MKARRKGTNEPFQKVASVCLCSGGYILVKDVEFEQPVIDHQQDLRERAAIAVLPQCVKAVQDALMLGATIKEGVIEQATASAIEIADALVERLKRD